MDKKEANMTSNREDNFFNRFLASSSAGIMITIFVMLIAFAIVIPDFFTPASFMNILVGAALMGVVAIGESMLLIAGHFDLSPGGIAALSGVLLAVLIKAGVNAGLTVVIVLFVGMLIGLANASLVNKLKFPPFIATLATASVARGFAYAMNKGQSTTINTESSILFLGIGRILGIPVPVWLLIIVTVFCLILLKFTKFGKHVYAIGGNAYISRLYGIKTDGVITILYVILAVLSALGGIMLAARMYTGSPISAQGLEFEAITAGILGGISLSGGVGSLTGAIGGIFVLQGFTNGLLLMNVPSYWQYVSRGMLLVVALTFDHIRRLRKR
jgi:ribose/xylose/arabinose/galactoside ABC-type transport system permease subunit